MESFLPVSSSETHEPAGDPSDTALLIKFKATEWREERFCLIKSSQKPHRRRNSPLVESNR